MELRAEINPMRGLKKRRIQIIFGIFELCLKESLFTFPWAYWEPTLKSADNWKTRQKIISLNCWIFLLIENCPKKRQPLYSPAIEIYLVQESGKKKRYFFQLDFSVWEIVVLNGYNYKRNGFVVFCHQSDAISRFFNASLLLFLCSTVQKL